MKKHRLTLLAALCCTAVLAVAGTMAAFAAQNEDLSQPIRVYGPVSKTPSGRLTINNQSDISSPGEIILNLSEHVRILDAVNGFPVAYDDIQEGETIYAYLSPVMALSLPPQTSPSMILCRIPADFKVPDYIQVESMERKQDSYVLTDTAGQRFTVPADCTIIPYLTRQMVTLENLTKGRTCLIWSDSSNNADKIVLFNESASSSEENQQEPSGSENTVKPFGWAKENGVWYFYNHDGSLARGWVNDGGKWYYLDPQTGVMQTGFLTVDGETYYMLEDGSMMTSARTFTPDENGVLH